MKGDFSKYRYRPGANYSSVLKQQGRVDLDSDWNEQAEILSERNRLLARDIIGEFGIPLASNEIRDDNSEAFKIDHFLRGPDGVIDFSIGGGVAYIGGNRYALENDTAFRAQRDYPEPEVGGEGADLLVYLEAWTKTVNYIDDETMREPALGGPDTCLRIKTIGQVKAVIADNIDSAEKALDFVAGMNARDPLLFTLKIDQSAHQIPISFGDIDMSGGLIPGNLHLRMELQRGPKSNGVPEAGFKWSDENAATVIRILESVENDSLIVEEIEPVTGESLKEGDWVEISNVITELHREGGQMARIESIDQGRDDILVTLDTEIHPLLRRFAINEKSKNEMPLLPRLRRWSGYVAPLATRAVYDLGRGIKATFHGPKDFRFNPGDFWSFAIREREYNKKYAPNKALPDGVRVYRHPLAIIRTRGGGKTPEIIDCRKFVKPLGEFPG